MRILWESVRSDVSRGEIPLILHAALDERPQCPLQHPEVWAGDLDDDHVAGALDDSVLSADERQRAERLLNDRAKTRFRRGRTVLRNMLARALNREPRDIQMSANAFGKPQLAREVGDVDSTAAILHFNLSHSENILVVAMSRRTEIGVDVELVQHEVSFLQLAECHFARAEFEQFRALPDAQQLLAFYKCWTMKEAVAKAVGRDLGFALDVVRIEFDSTGNARLATIPVEFGPISAWQPRQYLVRFGSLTAVVAIAVKPLQ